MGSQAVLLKGGHLAGEVACDLYGNIQGETQWMKAPKIITRNTHGTGCTLSAAIAACLGRKMNLLESCWAAKHYLNRALQSASTQTLGKGNGPVDHFVAAF